MVMWSKKSLLSLISVALCLTACQAQRLPVMNSPALRAQQSVQAPRFQRLAAQRAGLNAGFFYGMDDYNGKTLEGAQYLHWQLAQVGSNERLKLFLGADSDVKNDGIWAQVSQGQSWMGPGFVQRGELDTGSTPALRDFLSWMSRDFASSQNFVVLSSHGGGYRGIMYDYDGNISGPYKNLSLQQTFKAVGKGFQGSRLDGLHFAACMMATIEVGEALKGVTATFSASEDFSFGGSTPWEHIFAQQAQGQNIPQLLQDTVKSPFSHGAFAQEPISQTWSAVALNQDFEQLVKAMDLLARALIKALPAERQAIRQAAAQTRMFASMQKWSDHYADFHQRDIVDFCEQLLKFSQDPHVREDAMQVIAAVKRVVIAEAHSPDQTMAHGLAVYLPQQGMDPAYQKSVFAQHTHWDEFLLAFNSSF